MPDEGHENLAIPKREIFLGMLFNAFISGGLGATGFIMGLVATGEPIELVPVAAGAGASALFKAFFYLAKVRGVNGGGTP